MSHKEETPPLVRLQEMLVLYAQAVDIAGAAAQPLLERMEREYLKAAKERGRAVDRVLKMMASTR